MNWIVTGMEFPANQYVTNPPHLYQATRLTITGTPTSFMSPALHTNSSFEFYSYRWYTDSKMHCFP